MQGGSKKGWSKEFRLLDLVHGGQVRELVPSAGGVCPIGG